MQGRHFAVPALAAGLSVMLLAGCVSSAGIAPRAQTMEGESLGLSAQLPGPALGPAWWTAFDDTRLDALVASALEVNPSLKIARDRIERATAVVNAAQANGGPRVDGSVDLVRQRYTENGLYPPPIAGSVGNTGQLQAAGSWEIDFFGKNAAALAEAVGNQRAAQADAQAARVLLASTVARTYFQLGRLFEQRDVAERALAQRSEILSLIRQRVEAGLDTKVELHQGESAVPETEQQIEALDEQIVLTRHALAALVAQPPGAFDALSPRLRTVQAVPLPASVPVDLLGRRADIDAARQRVETATQGIAVAKAQLYPSVNLIAFIGLNALGVNHLLLDSSSGQYGGGAAIRLPIFDAGRLRANVQGKTAELDAAVDSYNATLIDAVRDAADQIASVQSVERQRRTQAAAQRASESAYDLALQRFRAGLGTYLTVLVAENSVLVQRRLAADLKARALDSQVALARALGGGYDAESVARVAADGTSAAAVAAR
jgi:NodT family efflux transporter outer membrane factor (OMF) lipoprotein